MQEQQAALKAERAAHDAKSEQLREDMEAKARAEKDELRQEMEKQISQLRIELQPSPPPEAVTAAQMTALQEVRKPVLLRHFILKTISLPRQARDKHREISKRERRFPTAAGAIARGGAAEGARAGPPRLFLSFTWYTSFLVSHLPEAYRELH
eukprot:COSAG06_NODE_1275_length_10046_cov_4.285915_5_plen_153_part_00